MTQVNLINMVTQMQPAGAERIIGNDAGRSADRPRNAEQRNLSSQGDPNTPNRHNIREDNRLEENQDSQLQPGTDRLGEFSAPKSAPEKPQDSAKPKKPKPEIDFEKVVAEILSDGKLSTAKPAGKVEKAPGILPVEMQGKASPFGEVLKGQTAGRIGLKVEKSILPTKPDGEVILNGTKELHDTAGKVQTGAAVAKNLAESAQVASAAVAVGKPQPQARQTADMPIAAAMSRTEVLPAADVVVQAGLARMNAEAPLGKAGVGQTESGEIKQESSVAMGSQVATKASANEMPIETGVNTAQVAQSARNTEAVQLTESAGMLAGTAQPAKSRAGDVAPPVEPAESRSQAQTADVAVADPEGKTAQAARLRAGRIAAYREVQQSGSSEAKPKSAPTPAISAGAATPAHSQTQNGPQTTRENFHIEHNTTAGELPNANIAVRAVQGEAGNTSQNLNAAAELLQPGELTGIATAGSVTGATATTAARAGSTEMIEQITAHIQASRDNLGEELTVRLDPPELGRVHIQLRTDGGGLRCVIRAEQARTLGELNREAPALIQRLNDAGIQVKDIEFQMNSQNQGRGNLPQNQAGNAFGEFGADSHGRGGQAEGEARSFSDSPSQSQQSYDLTAEEDDKYMQAGQYVSEDSINVMI